MWIIQESKKLALWNKRHFEEKNGEYAACLNTQYLYLLKKIYTMQHLEGSGSPSYIEDARFLKVKILSTYICKKNIYNATSGG